MYGLLKILRLTHDELNKLQLYKFNNQYITVILTVRPFELASTDNTKGYGEGPPNCYLYVQYCLLNFQNYSLFNIYYEYYRSST